jgi:LPXTG-motif cell wall-anchored protein
MKIILLGAIASWQIYTIGGLVLIGLLFVVVAIRKKKP